MEGMRFVGDGADGVSTCNEAMWDSRSPVPQSVPTVNQWLGHDVILCREWISSVVVVHEYLAPCNYRPRELPGLVAAKLHCLCPPLANKQPRSR